MLAFVMARCTTKIFIHDPLLVTAGSEKMPVAPGPAESVTLDLLFCLPAGLVLLRRLLRNESTSNAGNTQLRITSFLALAILSFWMLISFTWTADKFSSLIASTKWISCVALAWASKELVTDWKRFRLVAGFLFGLLLIYVAYGCNYKFVDLPNTVKQFNDHKEQFLAQRHLATGTFAARQFEEKVKLGEMFGFENSPNSFGAILSLLLIISAGLFIQRLVDRKPVAVANRSKSASSALMTSPVDFQLTTLVIGLLAGSLMLVLTRSRTAIATPFIAASMLLITMKFVGKLRQNPVRSYLLFLCLFIFGCIAIIGHGLFHGTLFHRSLTFRWHYWVGSASLLKNHLMRGVGWDNFGLFYLAHRLPIAPEEVKDPHNFIVRFFSETGVIGGVFLIGWQLRLWWELTFSGSTIESNHAQHNVDSARVPAFSIVLAIVGIGMLISIFISADISSPAFDIECLMRVLYAAVFLVGTSLVCISSLTQPTLNESPAPRLLYCMIASIAVFSIHNLVDFSLFENGPMAVFFLVVGSVLGVRSHIATTGTTTGAAASSHRWNLMVFSGFCILVLAVIIGWWVPVLQSQESGRLGDEALRNGRLSSAVAYYEAADRQIYRLNSDYPYRAAMAASIDQRPAFLTRAIAANPMDLAYFTLRAEVESRSGKPDAKKVKDDFNKAVSIDPNNVSLHQSYANALERLGDTKSAIAQLQAALAYNNKLPKDEIKRLKKDEVDAIEKKIGELSSKP